MTPEAWIAVVAIAIAALGGGFTAWNSLRNEIRDSRHMVMNKLQSMIEGLEVDIEKLGERMNTAERDIAILKARVS